MAYRFVCGDAGAPSCGARVRADSREELAQKIREHVRNAHNAEPNDTIVDYLVDQTVRQ